MSQNLIEMLRAREGDGHPTALAVLKEAMERDGEITDDARRHAAEVSGLPEAAVYGISTFYDDLVEPRGRRHVAVCTGTACWASHPGDHAAELGERLGVALGERSEDGSVSYGSTVCLGFCHSSPAYRDGTVVDAGPGALERVASGAAEQAPEPEGRTMLDEPVLLDGTGHLRRPAPGAGRAVARGAARGGQGGQPARPRRRRLPGRQEVVVRARRRGRREADRGQRRRGRPRLVHRQAPDGAVPAAAAGGHGAGRLRGRLRTRPGPGALGVPRLHARSCARPIEQAYAEGELGDDIHGSGFSFHVQVEEGAGSYVVGEETALLGSLQGLRGTVNARPPFPAQRGWHGKPTVVNNVETLCNAPYIAANGAEAYKALSPDATPGREAGLPERAVS